MSTISNGAIIALSVSLTLLTILVIGLVLLAVYKTSASRRQSTSRRITMPPAAQPNFQPSRTRRYSGSKLIGRDPLQESINWSNKSKPIGVEQLQKSKNVSNLSKLVVGTERLHRSRKISNQSRPVERLDKSRQLNSKSVGRELLHKSKNMSNHSKLVGSDSLHQLKNMSRQRDKEVTSCSKFSDASLRCGHRRSCSIDMGSLMLALLRQQRVELCSEQQQQ
ncbi:hypothetical protein BOX15_Mlig010419g3 [Macrostomum lignano]|uniref:Uncharacterized protein n=1 Tax=Macrostomum lignano TaxID=282301 RepID=A0A267GZE3_9PLAT|nr:hypothetical protein BOX15_Mlig010419g3 [Macrostomum lignano]